MTTEQKAMAWDLMRETLVSIVSKCPHGDDRATIAIGTLKIMDVNEQEVTHEVS